MTLNLPPLIYHASWGIYGFGEGSRVAGYGCTESEAINFAKSLYTEHPDYKVGDVAGLIGLVEVVNPWPRCPHDLGERGCFCPSLRA